MQTKFDYLISMMMNANIISKEGNNYAMNPMGAAGMHAINADDPAAFNRVEAFEF